MAVIDGSIHGEFCGQSWTDHNSTSPRPAWQYEIKPWAAGIAIK
jgi:hypothetical protein